MGQTPPPPHPEWCAHLVPPEMEQTSLYPEWYADPLRPEMGQIPLHPEWCAHHVPHEWCAHLVPSEMKQIPLFGEVKYQIIGMHKIEGNFLPNLLFIFFFSTLSC
ncbi:hypothetical protein CRYUN_Cryun38cG0020000 [Craigia yunnanensis]